jgi:hypothetical protein
VVAKMARGESGLHDGGRDGVAYCISGEVPQPRHIWLWWKGVAVNLSGMLSPLEQGLWGPKIHRAKSLPDHYRCGNVNTSCANC